MRRSPASHPRPLTVRECATLERIGRDLTHKDIAAEFGISINTVANLAVNAYKKLGAHSAAAVVLAHRDAHPCCGSRIDFGPILERIKAFRLRNSEAGPLSRSSRRASQHNEAVHGLR